MHQMIVHVTNASNAISILRDNRLFPGKGSNGQGERGDSKTKVYLQYILPDDVGRNLNDYSIVDSWDENVFLVIDERILLERADYHLTVDWEYGNFVQGKSSREFDKFVSSLKRRRPNPANEIVFASDVSLEKYLTAIWIGKEVSNEEAHRMRDASFKRVPILRTTFVPEDVIDVS